MWTVYTLWLHELLSEQTFALILIYNAKYFPNAQLIKACRVNGKCRCALSNQEYPQSPEELQCSSIILTGPGNDTELAD